MADIIVEKPEVITENGGPLLKIRYHDNGDGTFSEVMHPDATGGGGGAATIADGADVAEGAVADSAVAAGAAGTLSAKLRRLTADSGSSLTALQAIDASLNTPGQTTMSGSLPVVLASDQSTLPVGGNVASGATDSGNPVKVAGRYGSLPSLSVGQRSELQTDSKGQLRAVLGVNNDGAPLAASVDNADAVSSGGLGDRLAVISRQTGYNGATWDRLRLPNIFKTATATASGDTALWTPNSAKKFRLMKYMIQVSADAAAASGQDIDIILRDATTGLATSFTVYVPAVAGTAFGNTANSGWVDLGNGILSAVANNVLNINLSAALTSGKVRIVACGTEE